MTTATPATSVIIYVMDARFFIADFNNDLLKWDGSSFRKVGLGYGGNCWSIWSAIPFSSVEEVIEACRLHNFKVEGLVTGFGKEEEGRLWEEVQGLLRANQSS